jgi:hypothetical protein
MAKPSRKVEDEHEGWLRQSQWGSGLGGALALVVIVCVVLWLFGGLHFTPLDRNTGAPQRMCRTLPVGQTVFSRGPWRKLSNIERHATSTR